MRLFVLTRHGESTLNRERRVNGDPLRPIGLTELGREEARRLGEQVAQLALDACVLSRFPRARETAELALAGRPVPVLVDPLLDDIGVGELEDATIDEYRAWKAGRSRAEPFPGGESLDAAAGRYARAFRSLLESGHGSVLVVCHEIPVRYAVNAAAGSDSLDAPVHDIANATPYLFDEAALERAVAGIERLAAPS